MTFDEITLYESTRRTHGSRVADEALDVLSYRNVDKHGIEVAWTIAVRTVRESERFHDHGSGAVRRPRRVR
jgi:hypothetical protein